MSFFDKLKNRFKKEKSLDSIVWFPIWEDTDLMKKIKFSIFKSNPKSLKSGVKVNFKVVEYYSEIEEEKADLPLISVNDLMERFQKSSPDEFSVEGNFKPQIIKIENPIYIMENAIDKWEAQINVLESYVPERTGPLKEKLSKLRLSKNIEADFSLFQNLHSVFFNLFENLDKEIKKAVLFESAKGRKLKAVDFLGKRLGILQTHFGTLIFKGKTMGGGTMLPIFVPEDLVKNLPISDVFMGKILGVLYFYPRPLLINIEPGFVLLAAAISVGKKITKN